MKKQAQKLKKGDKVKLDGDRFIVERVEVSKIGKHGKSKCRLELIDKERNPKIVIYLADDLIEVE